MTFPVIFEEEEARPFWQALRKKNPLIHCMTNDVVQNITANILLASGASPAMVMAKEEAGGFAGLADGLLINVGTITEPFAEAMEEAVKAAKLAGKPWTLDPVAIGVLPYRASIVRHLLPFSPSVIRGNGAEILALAGRASSARGPDSLDGAEAALEAALELARALSCIIAVTGETDYITDGSKIFAVKGGHIYLTQVTGVGCSLSALCAAFVALSPDDRLQAIAACCLLMKRAGEQAAQAAKGPGSFSVFLLDALYQLTDISC